MTPPIVAYYRKSQESEDRQALSIPSQQQELQRKTIQLGLKIIKEYQESKSAKLPGRPIFNQMLEEVKKGVAQSIIVWNPDRLSRNPVDTGLIIHYMDLGFIKEIITPSQKFINTPNDKFLLNLLCSQAKLENDNRGINSKRGMKTKAEMGWYPAPAPLGYLNTPNKNKGFKTIDIDPQKFHLVKQIFLEILKGRQAIEVYLEARDKWILTTKENLPLPRSTFYSIIKNPLYSGQFEWPQESGNWYTGKHQPMISQDEFNLVQKMLGNKGRPIQRTHIHDFTGLIKCSCGYGITATKKTKHYKKTNRTAYYTYYHCSQKSRGNCQQLRITQTELEQQFKNLLDKIYIHQDFLDWAKEWLSVIHQNQYKYHETVIESQQKALLAIEGQLNRLIDLRINNQITDAIFDLKKIQLEDKKKELQEKLDDTNNNSDKWKQKVESILDFAHHAAKKFKTGTRDEKRQILLNIGSNLVLDNKKIRIQLHNHYQLLSEQEKWSEKFSNWIEPQEYTDILTQFPNLRPANPIWLRG